MSKGKPEKKMSRTKAQKRWDQRFTTKEGDLVIGKKSTAEERKKLNTADDADKTE